MAATSKYDGLVGKIAPAACGSCLMPTIFEGRKSGMGFYYAHGFGRSSPWGPDHTSEEASPLEPFGGGPSTAMEPSQRRVPSFIGYR